MMLRLLFVKSLNLGDWRELLSEKNQGEELKEVITKLRSSNEISYEYKEILLFHQIKE